MNLHCVFGLLLSGLYFPQMEEKKQLGTLNGSFFLEYSINVVILASLEFYMISCQFCNFLTL